MKLVRELALDSAVGAEASCEILDKGVGPRAESAKCRETDRDDAVMRHGLRWERASRVYLLTFASSPLLLKGTVRVRFAGLVRLV